MKSFASDNYAGVLPQVMQALSAANEEHAISYGADSLSHLVQEKFRSLLGTNADVLFVFNGTGANVLSLSAATHSYNAVLCADISHIYNDESSAPETFTGCRYFSIPSNAAGKLEPEVVRRRLIRKGDIHFAQIAVLSVTQSTEYGTVYAPAELKELSAICREHGLYFHIDGSRFFNAAASLDCTLKELITDTGADIVSLGGTKLGMMYGEAVIVLNEQLKQHIRFKQKQAMQLSSKARFIAAQFNALLEGELWRSTALHANAMAQLLADGLKEFKQVKVTMPVQANVVFAELPREWNKPLQEKFPFYIWKEVTNEARLMCAWDTTQADVTAFVNSMKQLAGGL
ncbi:threonine aldolase family protein [Chitinophagaceae bacterium MMS25-I14]